MSGSASQQEEPAEVTPLPVEAACGAPTQLGEPCRRTAVENGRCSYHLNCEPTMTVVDPLEVTDWTSETATLGVLSAGVFDEGRGRGSQDDSPGDVPDEEGPISDKQLIVDGEALRKRARHLHAVPDDATGTGQRWTYEPPDVVGVRRKRDHWRETMPDLSEAELDSWIRVYGCHMPPTTKKSYEAALDPFWRAAARAGFDPLRCDPALIEGHIANLMVAGKVGADGSRDPDKPYSLAYFERFMAAYSRALEAKGLPDTTASVDLKKLQRGHGYLQGSKLPRCAKDALLPRQLVEIERHAREGTTAAAATIRAAVTLGCDPEFGLGLTSLCRLTFADIRLSEDRAVLNTVAEGCLAQVVVVARPGDPACPVAAIKSLREARYRRMRASNGGAPTRAQMDAQSLFLNARTGKPLTRPGLKHMVAEACAGVVSSAEVAGGLPQLTPELRREVLALGINTKTARDLMMIFHTIFATARVGEAGSFDVGDVMVFGYDQNGTDHLIPLVDRVLPDGTVVAGIIDRVAVVTETDLLDASGESLYASGLIAGVYNRFRFGTKTLPYHENWYPAQAGFAACPVRLLIQGLKVYDRLLIAHAGRRLTVDDPLFTSLKHPGRGFSDKQMSKVLGGIVKEAVAELGLNPKNYSGHSLRKVRATYVISVGGSDVEVSKHDGRKSPASNLPYVQIDPRYPFAGDPTVGIYGEAAEPAGRARRDAGSAASRSSHTPGSSSAPVCVPGVAPAAGSAQRPAPQQPADIPDQASHTMDPITPIQPPSAPDPMSEAVAPRAADAPAAELDAPGADPAVAAAQWISDFRAGVDKLRTAGLDDSVIAALAGLRLP